MYRDLTSHVTNNAFGGMVCFSFSSLILRRKSLSSFRYDGSFLTSGWSCISIHFDKLIVGVLIVLQMGRPGGGLISECILGRKYMFPGLGESINKRSANSSSITSLTAALLMASPTSRTNLSVQSYESSS